MVETCLPQDTIETEIVIHCLAMFSISGRIITHTKYKLAHLNSDEKLSLLIHGFIIIVYLQSLYQIAFFWGGGYNLCTTKISADMFSACLCGK